MASRLYRVFGGTFDPFDAHHLACLRRLLFLTSADSGIVIAPTVANPFKTKEPEATLEQRREMIGLVLRDAGIEYGEEAELKRGEDTQSRVVVSHFSYSRIVEFIHYWRANYQCEIEWVVSSDIWQEVLSWKDVYDLGIAFFPLPLVGDGHAADIRTGKREALACLRSYITGHGLYGPKNHFGCS